MRFRKKQIEIEAVQFLGGRLTEQAPLWVDDATLEGKLYRQDQSLFIETPEGVMEAKDGDWIIRGVAGEIYPCKPDIFEASYEEVPQGDKELKH